MRMVVLVRMQKLRNVVVVLTNLVGGFRGHSFDQKLVWRVDELVSQENLIKGQCFDRTGFLGLKPLLRL